jgi:hypothetical protein
VRPSSRIQKMIWFLHPGSAQADEGTKLGEGAGPPTLNSVICESLRLG